MCEIRKRHAKLGFVVPHAVVRWAVVSRCSGWRLWSTERRTICGKQVVTRRGWSEDWCERKKLLDTMQKLGLSNVR